MRFLVYLWSHHLMRVWARFASVVCPSSAPWVSVVSILSWLLPFGVDRGQCETCRINFVVACKFGTSCDRMDTDHPNPIFPNASVLAGLYGDLGRLKLFLGTLRVWMFSPWKAPTLFRRCLGRSRVVGRTNDRMLQYFLQRRSSAPST